jgi:sulfite reductase (NADPH) hemoprotein beta-component
MNVQVITANRLRDGAIVWLTADRRWSEAFTASLPLRDEGEAEAALESTKADVKARLVVGPYLAEVKETPEGLEPASARERIRASGQPSVPADHGSWTKRIAG